MKKNDTSPPRDRAHITKRETCGWAEQKGFQLLFEGKEENVTQTVKLAITEEV